MPFTHGTAVELIDELPLVSGLMLRAGTVLWVDAFYPSKNTVNLIRPHTCDLVACLVPVDRLRVVPGGNNEIAKEAAKESAKEAMKKSMDRHTTKAAPDEL